MSKANAAALGGAIVKSCASLLAQDLSLTRVHHAHQQVMECLQVTHPQLKLFTFGSSAVYGFHEPKSDVDFVALSLVDIKDGKGEDSSSQLAKGLQNELLTKLAKTMRQRNLTWNVEEVKRTRVPVVRVKTQAVDFDVTAFRRNGVRNSALLRSYFEQEPQTRWLSMAVKAWSKRTGMNGPHGFLTSYGFNILCLYYLMQRGVIKFVDPDACDVSQIEPIPQQLSLLPPVSEQLLGEQVLDFLEYYLTEFDWENKVVSLSRERQTTRLELNWTRDAEDQKMMSSEKVAYRLCIEDPYEINLNVGRNVTAFKMDLFRKHLEKGRATGLGLALN